MVSLLFCWRMFCWHHHFRQGSLIFRYAFRTCPSHFFITFCQGNINTVREMSGKCQGILKKPVAMNPAGGMANSSNYWPALCAGLLCCNFFDMLTPVPFYHFFCSLILLFIRPFEKRDVLCCGNVRPSVCPSVRPSVRVFRTFLQHALRYQFETWYIHSVGGTTCPVCVASQLGHFDLVHSQK